MKLNAKVDVRSRRELIKFFSNADPNFRRKLGESIAFTVRSIANETTSDASFPFISGFLKGSYDADDSKAMSQLTGSAFSVAEYAPNVEYGINQREQSYFRPAVKNWREKFEKAVDNLLEKTINE
jgi:hypothetical protein